MRFASLILDQRLLAHCVPAVSANGPRVNEISNYLSCSCDYSRRILKELRKPDCLSMIDHSAVMASSRSLDFHIRPKSETGFQLISGSLGGIAKLARRSGPTLARITDY